MATTGSQIRGGARKRFTAQPISQPAPNPWCRREPSRARVNIAAIELLGELRARRPATPAEQRVLAAWSGWGAVPEAFDRRDDRFAAERDRATRAAQP